MIITAVAALLSLLPADVRAADVTRRDDAFHFAQFRDGQHDANYAEWWYFNLIDRAQGLELALTYAVIDPANLTGFGTASVVAIAYTPNARFTETAVYPSTAFAASADQADVLVAGGSPFTLNIVQVLSDDVYQTGAWLGADREHVGVFPWEQMSWLQYMPGALVAGDVTIDGHVYHVANTRGYHDHNWGEWVPFTVAWNWAQYFEPGLNFSIGDFRNSATGVVSVDVSGERTVFAKNEYVLIHDGWNYDAANQVWFPSRTWMYAQNALRTLIVSMGARETVPVRPPPQLPLPLVPVIYEQTADFIGWLWDRNSAGEWTFTRAFGGAGYKEYTGISPVQPH
jgi:hypothetical protein